MTQIDQAYLTDLEKIVDMNSVDRNSDSYLKYKSGLIKRGPDGKSIKDSDFTLPLGKAINLFDPNMFLNETQSAIEYETDQYKTTHKIAVEKAIKDNKDQLLRDYVQGINAIVKKQTEHLKSDLEKKLKDATPEQKKQILELNLYSFIGNLMKDLDLTRGYKENKDLVEAVNGLKALQDAGDSERNEMVADLITEQRGLSDNYKNFRRPWGELGNQMIENYTRVIGKQLLKETNGKYSINEEVLKKAYDNPESIKKMSPVIASKYRGS